MALWSHRHKKSDPLGPKPPTIAELKVRQQQALEKYHKTQRREEISLDNLLRKPINLLLPYATGAFMARTASRRTHTVVKPLQLNQAIPLMLSASQWLRLQTNSSGSSKSTSRPGKAEEQSDNTPR